MKNLLSNLLDIAIFTSMVLSLVALASYSSYKDPYPFMYDPKDKDGKWFNDILIHDKLNPENF